MALTRSFLRGLKLDEEQVSAIIEAHAETVDGLKAVNSDIQKKLDDAEKKLEAEQKNGWAEKYDKLNKEYEGYKEEQTKKETMAAKEKAYINLLKSAGVSEKRIDGIIKYDNAKIEAIEFDEKGEIKNASDLTKAIKTDWADFITISSSRGASVSTPPMPNGGAKLTKAQIYERDDHGHYKLSTAERQEALMNMASE